MLLKLKIFVYDVVKTTNSEICKILKMPFFYHEVLSAFYRCRKQKQPQSLTIYDFLTIFLLHCSNSQLTVFTFKIALDKSVLLVRYLFDQNGNMY